MKKLLSLIAMVVLIASCSTPSSVSPMSVPLTYKAMLTPGELPALPACASVSAVEVEDGRDEKALGKRYVEGKQSAVAPVTASTDVAAWVRTGVENEIQRAGGSFAKAARPVLHLRIEQINTNENVLHRSGYEAHMSVSAELRAAGSSTPCWKDRVEGSSENYGYAGSVENYQETLNHALDRATARILSSPDFKKAVCSCGS
jgi:uncharacterized lipoprotein YajG